MKAAEPVFDLAAFDYPLPESAVAQEPAARREASRLLVVERQEGVFREALFSEIPGFFSAADLLVFNDTRVIPARLRLSKPTGGAVEVLVLRLAGEHLVEALVRGRVRPGMTLEITRPAGAPESVEKPSVTLERKQESGAWIVSFPALSAAETLNRFGEIPLPPYIRRAPRPADRASYQTVYARRDGAVAAPTAGLHFTPELIAEIEGRGAESVFVTLHVGWGTFRTVRAPDIRGHRMEEEICEISAAAARRVNAARSEGRRVTAVGTTVVRSLEGAFHPGGFKPVAGPVGIFIYPGYRFRVVERMITNFHLPRTTTLFMTAAFCGRELLLEAYRFALDRGFRFGSYGDAMLIL